MRRLALSSLLLALPLCGQDPEPRRPNVLFIAMDDLNDWVGCLGGHPQARTPNLDALAKRGILFTNAHCAAPSCNPSRTAIMTGRAPNRSGVYANGQRMRDVLPEEELLPKTFARQGYRAAGAGKLLHYFIDERSWDEYFPAKETEMPLPRTKYPDKRPLSLPRGGPWQYVETDWGPLDCSDEEFGGDWLVSEWIGKELRREQDKPFFLAAGIYRPHEPWFVPKEYFDLYPLAEVQLPPGYKADDLEDLPPAGKRRGPNRYFAHIRKHKQWRQGVQGYLASIAFADAMLGRILKALREGPHADNTIVVLWSDHGWHLGEKQHWQKYTAWRACTRVPLIVQVPEGALGLPAGTRPGVCSRPVNLLSLFPTLMELCKLEAGKQLDGPSLVPLLRDPKAAWPHVSVTYLGNPGSFGMSTDDWRYIRYGEGQEELYQISEDPYEWRNLAGVGEHADLLAALRARAPKSFVKKPEPKVASLPRLAFRRLQDAQQPPPSKPDGNPFTVHFLNRSGAEVELLWVSPRGVLRKYGSIAPGRQKRQQTRPGAVWAVRSGAGQLHGYFVVGDRRARAEIRR